MKPKIQLIDLLVDDLPLEFVELAATRILESDPAMLNRWFGDSSEKVSVALSDRVAMVAADFFRDQNKYDLACDWAGRLSDAEEGRVLRAQIWHLERRFLLEQLSTDPVEALMLVIKTDDYADYWVGRLLDVWLEKDAGSARAWYDGFQGALSERQLDFARGSFARTTIKAGRRSTALAWLKKVVAEDIRQQILIDYPELDFDGQDEVIERIHNDG